MKTEFLSEWERLAIQESVENAIDKGIINEDSGLVLLEKLEYASNIRVSYRTTN